MQKGLHSGLIAKQHMNSSGRSRNYGQEATAADSLLVHPSHLGRTEAEAGGEAAGQFHKTVSMDGKLFSCMPTQIPSGTSTDGLAASSQMKKKTRKLCSVLIKMFIKTED